MLKIIVFPVLVMVLILMLPSCKTDTEDDLNIQSNLNGVVLINEVYAANPDWIELYNTSDSEVSLDGCILQDDKGAAEEYILPAGMKIPAKGFLVLEGGTHFQFGISSSKGDVIKLFDRKGAIISEVSVPITAVNQSYARTTDGGKEWAITEKITKGKSNLSDGDEDPQQPQETGVKVCLNEILSAPAGDDVDFIELFNNDDKEFDLSGYMLQDDKGSSEEFIIPKGTKIAPRGFLVFSQVSPGGNSFTFGLSSKGDKVIFLTPDRKIIETVITPNFGDVKGKSFGRVTDGANEWKQFDTPTKGKSNNNAQ